MTTSTRGTKEQDLLNGMQLHQAASIIQAGDDIDHKAQGPIKAIVKALKFYGWKMLQAHILVNEEGAELDMSVGSPAMLKDYVVLSHDSNT